MRRRYLVAIERDDGWSDWLEPVMTGYRLACCDCGLVHALDFRIENDRVQFRAKRHKRATAAMRAWKNRAAAQKLEDGALAFATAAVASDPTK